MKYKKIDGNMVMSGYKQHIDVCLVYYEVNYTQKY